jgi:Flp pilus assembly protein TadG
MSMIPVLRQRENRLLSPHERGVAAVEMALMAPLLVLLFFGVVETSWLLAQALDVRQAAREGGRLAAIDFGDSAVIASEVCITMDNDDDTTVQFTGSAAGLGEDISVTVTKSASHLTSFLNWVFPPTMTLSNTATFALEVSPPTWNDGPEPC